MNTINRNVDIMVFVEVIRYVYLCNICITDINKRIIPDRHIIVLFFLGLTEAVLKMEIGRYYIGMCMFCMPLLFLYITGDFFGREFIGFGDIKLMMVIGGVLQMGVPEMSDNTYIQNVLYFYRCLYIISGFFSLLMIIFLKIYGKIRNEKYKVEYLPFAPFIVATYMIIRSTSG